MKLDTVLHRGDDEKPAVIFIHGLGMDKNVWTDPFQSRILGGLFPLRVLLGKYTEDGLHMVQTLFHDLERREYTVVTWSQKRPAGPIEAAVSELSEIGNIARETTKAGIILIGHSRGGLIGRKYLNNDEAVRGLITISTPHRGSSVAGLAKYFSPLGVLLEPLLPRGDKDSLSSSLRRICEFLKSRALKELLPDSKFFKSLKDGRLGGISYISAGGTSPTLISIYNISFPDIFEKIIPEHLYPEEIKKGKGDGLVSVESSKIPWSDEHYNFDCNHVEMLFDKKARDTLLNTVERISQI